jgi:hypothetical protein
MGEDCLVWASISDHFEICKAWETIFRRPTKNENFLNPFALSVTYMWREQCDSKPIFVWFLIFFRLLLCQLCRTRTKLSIYLLILDILIEMFRENCRRSEIWFLSRKIRTFLWDGYCREKVKCLIIVSLLYYVILWFCPATLWKKSGHPT